MSVLAALLLAGLATAALLAGVVSSSRFTAHGALQVDCTTRQAITGQPVGLGAPVRIYQVRSGEIVASTEFDRFEDLDAEACFASFQVGDVPVADGGYLIRIGDLPARLVSKEALEQGVVFNG
ncbi:MAG: hypothetical protein WAW85_15605 [Gordonia sp. (in: high G+C Gram-positive bacteria)]